MLFNFLISSFAVIFGTCGRESGERCILFAIQGRKFKVPWHVLARIGTYWHVLARIGTYWNVLERIGEYW
jgi:hypothetical protein